MGEKKINNKKYGLFAATIFGVNSMIGSGIFLLPASLYNNMGPSSILTVFIDILIVLLFAFCFADASGYISKNGGAYQYAKLAFGNFVGFNVGFLGWITSIIGWSAMAMGFAELMISLLPNLNEVVNIRVIIATCLIVTLVIINNFGSGISNYLSSTITIAKLIPLVGFSVVSLFFIHYGLQLRNFSPFFQLKTDNSFISSLNNNALLLFYGFLGFETLPIIAGQVKQPQKNIPKAVIMSTFIVAIIYFLIILGTIAILGNDTNGGAPVQRAFTKMIGPAGGLIISIGALISVGGLNMSAAISIPPIAQSLVKDSLLPKKLGTVNRWDSPYLCALLSSSLAIGLVLSGSFEQLVTLGVLMFFVQYIPTALAVIVFKRRSTINKEDNVFSLPFGSLIPILAVASSFWILSSATLVNILFLIGSLLVASLLYYCNYTVKKK